MEKQFDIVAVDGYWYGVDNVREKLLGWCIHPAHGLREVDEDCYKSYPDANVYFDKRWRKIVASDNPSLDVPLLPPVEQDVYSTDDLKEASIHFCDAIMNSPSWSAGKDLRQLWAESKGGVLNWIDNRTKKRGEAAQSKQFTIEDMREAWELGAAYGTAEDDVLPEAKEAQDKFIQSLQPVPKAVVLKCNPEDVPLQKSGYVEVIRYIY